MKLLRSLHSFIPGGLYSHFFLLFPEIKLPTEPRFFFIMVWKKSESTQFLKQTSRKRKLMEERGFNQDSLS